VSDDGGSCHDDVGESDGKGTVSGPVLWEEPTLLADKTGWGMWEEDEAGIIPAVSRPSSWKVDVVMNGEGCV